MTAVPRPRLLWLWFAATLALGLLPPAVGWHASTRDRPFIGYVHLYPEDPATHLAWAR